MKDKDTRKYRLKVTCLTPKKQAEKCMEKWKKTFPTFYKPVEEKLVSDTEFYWVYEIEGLDKMQQFHKKVLMLEAPIKKVMRMEMKLFKRANKLINKSAWGLRQVKNWIKKQWKKNMQYDENMQKQLDDLDNMPDEKFKEYLKIEDEAEIVEFLQKDIIQTSLVEMEETKVEENDSDKT